MGQAPIPPTPVWTDLSGKTVIVTGGNAGMGKEAARQYLTLHASRVILAVRSKARGQEAASEIRADPEVKKKNPGGRIEVFELDLDDYQSGLAFSKRVKAEVRELDIMLLNGGVNVMKYQTSKSGHERVVQVNAYTHLLITLELLPLLRATAVARGTPSRVTFVGSTNHLMHTLAKKPIAPNTSPLTHFDDRKVYSGFMRYGDSKLIVAAYVRKLATVIPSKEVIFNDPCPGLVATGFDKELPAWLKPIMFVYRKISARTVEEGARTLIYASAVAGQETNGKFLQSNKVQPGAPWLDESAGKEFTEKLWRASVEDVAKIDPTLKEYA